MPCYPEGPRDTGDRAIESNINKVIASRFKKRGMSWSKKGATQPSKNKRDYLK